MGGGHVQPRGPRPHTLGEAGEGCPRLEEEPEPGPGDGYWAGASGPARRPGPEDRPGAKSSAPPAPAFQGDSPAPGHLHGSFGKGLLRPEPPSKGSVGALGLGLDPPLCPLCPASLSFLLRDPHTLRHDPGGPLSLEALPPAPTLPASPPTGAQPGARNSLTMSGAGREGPAGWRRRCCGQTEVAAAF